MVFKYLVLNRSRGGKPPSYRRFVNFSQNRSKDNLFICKNQIIEEQKQFFHIA